MNCSSAGKEAAVGLKNSNSAAQKMNEMGGAEDNICLLLGLDIEKSALEIVKADFKRKKIPLSKAGKYLTASNPYSAHSSAAKSFNASATKSATKPTLNSTQSGVKNNSAAAPPSAFLSYDTNVAPYKRSRIESGTTFGQEKLFNNTHADTSARSKKSARAADSYEGVFLTPLNQAADQKKEINNDPILDDDFDIPAPSQFNHEQVEEVDPVLKTPSPGVKKQKFDLSELDSKQITFPDPPKKVDPAPQVAATSEATEMVI